MGVVHRIPPRAARVGGAEIERLLPHRSCRKVGPWVFLDRFGPVEMTMSAAMDVRPHPHCGLSTVSFLFDGQIEHRDSTGGHARIGPGEVHWMRAGHGIVHSERVPQDRIGRTERRFGLQLWCAHADGEEEQDPAFSSWRELPDLDVEGVRVRLLAGSGWGEASPVDVTSPLVYAMAHMKAGQRLLLPDHQERAIYSVQGEIAIDGDQAGGDLLVVDESSRYLTAVNDAVVAILGGRAIGPRFIWWNLVHSDKGRLREQAERWRRREFPSIPEDDEEFMPAPDWGP